MRTLTQKRELREFMAYKGPRILLVNVESLSTKTGSSRAVQQVPGRAAPTTMVIDESTTIKNIDAARTETCLALGVLAKKRRILSGLPSPQSPLDLFSQFYFLDPNILGFHRYSAFEQRYAIMSPKPFGPGGRMINVIAGYQNLDELKAKIEPHSFRVRLAECYDLPEKMFIRRDVTLTDEQKTRLRADEEVRGRRTGEHGACHCDHRADPDAAAAPDPVRRHHER